MPWRRRWSVFSGHSIFYNKYSFCLPITARRAGWDTRLSCRVTLLLVTPHCHSPLSRPAVTLWITRLQFPAATLLPTLSDTAAKQFYI